MTITLTPYEARIIGCLLEKEVTTPDQYPLTLNSLTSAANQKSNREPVYSLDEATVMDTIEALKEKRLVSGIEGFGSRVTKYQHRFCNTEFGNIRLPSQELAVICVLLLRGPQTPGELRTRTNRLCQFSDVSETESVLKKLIEKEYVAVLPREPGKRESRYMHLFGDEDLSEMATVNVPEHGATSPAEANLQERVALLENEVSELKAEIQALKALFE
ncbi:DUF480 domain-containing protein [Parasalinivibrio latis]|uniref:YceH family protein n=1 Tax=Parasalinivibrio latis TaxID=2952610 RepID=UPI0030E531DF